MVYFALPLQGERASPRGHRRLHRYGLAPDRGGTRRGGPRDPHRRPRRLDARLEKHYRPRRPRLRRRRTASRTEASTSESTRRGFPRELAELADTLTAMAASLDEKMRALDRQKPGDGRDPFGDERRAHRARTGRPRRAGEPRRLRAFLPQQQCRARYGHLSRPSEALDVVDFVARAREDGSETTVELKAPSETKSLLVRLSRADEGGSEILVFSDITPTQEARAHQERLRRERNRTSSRPRSPRYRASSRTLKDGAIDDPRAARRFLDIMDGQTSRLGAIIDDLLTISRLEQSEDPRSRARRPESTTSSRAYGDSAASSPERRERSFHSRRPRASRAR